MAPSGRDAQLSFVGVNYADLGAQKAKIIVDTLGGSGTIGWIHGIRGQNFSERRIQGASPVFKAASGIKAQNGPHTGAFSSDAGLTATENLLARAPGVNAMMFDNDDIALGGIQAIKEKGLRTSSRAGPTAVRPR